MNCQIRSSVFAWQLDGTEVFLLTNGLLVSWSIHILLHHSCGVASLVAQL